MYADTIAILDALRSYANKRPGLEPGDYIDRYATGATRADQVRGYDRERARITRDRERAMIRLDIATSCAERGWLTVPHLLKAAQGDRLTLVRSGGTWSVEYVTGQYWPTEYRAAVARVVERALRVSQERPELRGDCQTCAGISDRPGRCPSCYRKTA